jgi:hypothetical protein
MSMALQSKGKSNEICNAKVLLGTYELFKKVDTL